MWFSLAVLSSSSAKHLSPAGRIWPVARPQHQCLKEADMLGGRYKPTPKGMFSLFQSYLRYKISVQLLTEGKLWSVQQCFQCGSTVETTMDLESLQVLWKLDSSHLNNFLGRCQSVQSAETMQLCTEPKQRPRLGCLWNHKTKLKTKPVTYAEWKLSCIQLDSTVPPPLWLKN